MHISHSRVACYLSCPYKHYLAYEVGVSVNKPVRPLRFGTDFHKLLELRNQPDKLAQAQKAIEDAYYEMPAAWQDELGANYVQDLNEIFMDYCTLYKDTMQPTETEHEFNIHVCDVNGEPFIFKGVIDELYKRKHKGGQRYIKLGEHKTFNRKPDHNALVMNTQKNLYAKAVQLLLGMLPETVIWDYIHSTPASEPIWLVKSSRFSTAKSNNITPFSYIRACERHSVMDDAVLLKAKQFECNIPNFFFRVEMDIVPSMVEQVWQGFSYTGEQIIAQGHKNKARNMGSNCTFCDFRDICYTQLTGGNLENLIQSKYVVTKRNDIQVEERKVKEPVFDQFVKEENNGVS